MSQTITYQAVATNFGGVRLPDTRDSTLDINCNFVGSDQRVTVWALSLASSYDPTDTSTLTIQTTLISYQGETYPPTISITPAFTVLAPEKTSSAGIVSQISHSVTGTATAAIPLTLIDLEPQTNNATTTPKTSTTNQAPLPTGPTFTSTTSNFSSSASTSLNPTAVASDGANTSNGTPANPHSGLSTGGRVGAIVGCLIAAILIAGLLVCFWLKRRKRSRAQRYVPKRDVHKSDIDGESFKLATGSMTNRQKHLPQPESDQTISRLANRTLDDIELFVENYYVDRPTTQASSVAASNISTFNSPHLGRPLIDIIQTSKTPTALLKHCITYYLLQKIDPKRNDSSSLLPGEFVVPPKGDRRLLSELRVQTAHSHSNIDQNENYLVRRDSAAQSIIQQVERAFQPWARSNTQDRVKNLRGILTHVSELGNKLFSQPATFEWRWSESRTLSLGQIVMLPGLDKMTDSQAALLATPICLAEPRLGTLVQ